MKVPVPAWLWLAPWTQFADPEQGHSFFAMDLGTV